MSARAWRELDHPRHLAGSDEGGRFRSKAGDWASLLSDRISLLRSDGTLLPPGPTKPDFSLIDEDRLLDYEQKVREYAASFSRVGDDYHNHKYAGRMAEARESVLQSVSDSNYADQVLGQRRLQVALEEGLEQYRRKVARGVPPEQFKQGLSDQLKQMFAGREIAIRVWHDRLERMLERGRLTTLHETGRSSGSSNTLYRAEYERDVFGIPLVAPWQDRPVYGYMPSRPEGDMVAEYGDVKLVLKDEVRKRTTAMFGDSLGSETGMPTPIDDPDWRSWNVNLYGVDDYKTRSVDDYGVDDYVEIQVHGGVEVSDIEKVVFGSDPDPKLTRKLDELGIRWEIKDLGGLY